jgi:hypothetical protein
MAEGPVWNCCLVEGAECDWRTMDRLARLMKVQKEFGEAKINGEAAIIQAIRELARS